MAPPMKPWERINWGPEQEQIIYRDWGRFFMHTRELERAINLFDKALEIKSNDFKTLLYRSKAKRGTAHPAEALKDGLAAQAFSTKQNVFINLEICDALYELNQFENCDIELHNQTKKFKGKKVEAFYNRINVVTQNFEDSIGESLGPFIMKNSKHFDAVLADIERRFNIDGRPLYKILREQGKCDVLSILEKEEILLSPREIARRHLAFKVFNQIYFNKNWIDMCFLKDLHGNPDLLLKQAVESMPILRQIVATHYIILKKFLKNLNARSPLYNEVLLKCPDKKREFNKRENNFNRLQYQTHRNMMMILKNIKQMRSSGEIQHLSQYIEEVMGEYVVIKTHRIMPWKLEFMYEVYNTLALALTDRLTIPETFPRNKSRLMALFRMNTDKKDRVVLFKFGDKSTFQEADAIDQGLIAYKQFLARMDKRMKFAKHGIEKCYLLHEIARRHMNKSHFDECCSVARLACEEAKKCKSYIYHFLSLILICKSHVVLNKVESCKEVLEETLIVAEKLCSVRLCDFVELCIKINYEAIYAKKRTLSNESIRKRRSKMSAVSKVSAQSSRRTSDLDSSDVYQ